MSLVEKHRIVEILTAVLVWGIYFLHFARRISEGGLADPGFILEMGCFFVMGLVAVVVMEVILTLIARRSTSRAEREARDEREHQAGLAASQTSLFFLLAVLISLSGLAFLVGVGALSGAMPWPEATEANRLLLVANLLLACVIVSELVRFGAHLALLRRYR